MSERPVVLIAEEVSGAPVTELAAWCCVRAEPDLYANPDRLKEAVATADALIVRNQTQVTRDVFCAAPRLKVVGRAGAGLDNIDIEAAEELGIVVAAAREENAVSVAELAIGLMLALARSIHTADAVTKQGTWQRYQFVGTELAGKTLGLLGLGRVGFRVAMRARAFGMQVCAHDPYVSSQHAFVTEAGVCLVPLSRLLAVSDVISIHVPLTDKTRGMLGEAEFSRMRPGVLLVNTSRGPIVDESALIKALLSGRVAGAALDVRENEPPEPGVLESLPNVILTPHIGAFTYEAMHRVVAAIVQDVKRVLRGEPAVNAVGCRWPRRPSDNRLRV